MSARIVGAVERLIALLEKHFSPHGNPPEQSHWLFDVQKERNVNRHRLESDGSFRALCQQKRSKPVAEAIDKIRPLREVSEALLDVSNLIAGESSSPRVHHLQFVLDKLLDSRWVHSVSTSSELSFERKPRRRLHRFGYTFQEPNAELVGELREAARQLIKPEAADLDADEQAIVDLIKNVGHRLTTTAILAEFSKRNEIKAESTTKLKLSRLTKAGILNNRTGSKRGGYGLPEWP